MKTNLDKRIDALRPGQIIEISKTGMGRCTVERSGDGSQLRFVRHTTNGWTVFKVCNF
jgi:hypothetical protein